uniref:Uncharacterized protein n=1 Tax=Hucho hucho TaxID=62062 RepID=A0A4W5M171_9TELE
MEIVHLFVNAMFMFFCAYLMYVSGTSEFDLTKFDQETYLKNESITMTLNPKFKYEDWAPTFMLLNFVNTMIGHMWTVLGKEAFVGYKAPDSPATLIFSVNFCLPDNRPLVLSFGSCT